MPLIKVNSLEEAQEAMGPLFAAELREAGFISGASLLLSARPEVLVAWQNLSQAVQVNLSPRRAGLVAFAAALALKSTYLILCQAAALTRFFSPRELETLALDYHKADLETVEVALMDFSQKIALSAYRVTNADIRWLHSLGLGDAEIADIALMAAAQCFLSRVTDGLGAEPDPVSPALDADLISLLTIGRRFE